MGFVYHMHLSLRIFIPRTIIDNGTREFYNSLCEESFNSNKIVELYGCWYFYYYTNKQDKWVNNKLAVSKFFLLKCVNNMIDI